MHDGLGEAFDTASYALVKEEHCKGHEVARSLSIDDYRKEQGVEEYDELARGWRQLVLKKKSSGPTVGKPSLKSRQLFFMACYDHDQFRAFVASEAFGKLFALSLEERERIVGDDVELMGFGFRFLRQVMFGEESIALNDAAAQERLTKVKEKQAREEKAAAERLAAMEDGDYPFEDE